MYTQGKPVNDILHLGHIVYRVYHMGEIVYDKDHPIHTNINPDPTRYIPIEYLSEYFNKDFENDYWYFTLFYIDQLGDKCSNFFYWKKSEGVTHSQEGSILTVTHTDDVECYNYFNTSSGPNEFNYDVGHDSIPGKFTFDASLDVAQVYNADGSVKWTSPSVLGLETNIPITLEINHVYVTPDNQLFLTKDDEVYVLNDGNGG